MNKLIAISFIVISSGCTTSARNTPEVVSDNAKYDSFSCNALYQEANYLAIYGTELSKAVDSIRANDMVLIGFLGILSFPVANIDQNTSENESLAKVKGDMGLIEEISSKNNCSIKFESNESESYIVDNSTNPILGLKPINQSVVYKVVKSN